jgi:hypothetical protein
VREIVNFQTMKKMQSLSAELLKTLEGEEMQKLQGGFAQATKGVDCCSMTGKGAGTTGSKWDGEDPYTD